MPDETMFRKLSSCVGLFEERQIREQDFRIRTFFRAKQSSCQYANPLPYTNSREFHPFMLGRDTLFL
jgi:hypothetical protein